MLVALAITLVLWLFFTLFFASSTTIQNANRVSYNRLKNMQTELLSQLEIIHQRLNLQEHGLNIFKLLKK